jgi:hypothetical protein
VSDQEEQIGRLPSDVPDDFDDAIDRFGEQADESPWSGGTVVASIPIPLEDDLSLPAVAKERGATIASTQIEPLPEHVSAMVEFEGSTTQVFQITKTVSVIGRAAGAADLVLPWNEEASRQHCAILYAQRTFWLEDLQSSNGTYVNEQPVARVRMKSGDKIRIGTQVLVLRFRV